MSLVQGELSARLFCLVYPMLSGPVLFSVCGMLLGYQSPVCRYCILSFSSLPLLGFVTAAPCLSFIASGDVQCSVQPSWWGPGPCVTFMLIVLGCRSFVFYSFLDENTPQEQPRWASGQGRACGVSRGSPVMSRAHSQHAGPRGSAGTASQDTPIFKPRWANSGAETKGAAEKLVSRRQQRAAWSHAGGRPHHRARPARRCVLRLIAQALLVWSPALCVGMLPRLAARALARVLGLTWRAQVGGWALGSAR